VNTTILNIKYKYIQIIFRNQRTGLDVEMSSDLAVSAAAA
jgi:hypothetical protein